MEISVAVNNILIFMLTNVAFTVTHHELFTIDTDGCKIPAYPMMTARIQALMAPPPAAEVNCSSRVQPLVKTNSTHMWIVQGLDDVYQINNPSELYCCYRNFSARKNLENVAYGVCQDFTNVIKAHHEFVRVECFNEGDKIYEDFFRFNVGYENKNFKKLNNNTFHVIMFGIDSISRKNFLRTMPNTAKFLKSKGSIQLYGYNKLGDNSFPNLFPLLAAKSFEEVRNVCFKNNVHNLRACPFVWDKFKSAGYRTALGSDSGIGVLGAYESLLRFKPTNFYMQTFMYETRHTYKDRTYDYHLCLRDRYMYKELLQFADDVITTTAQNGKLFALFWEESVSHHDVNYPYILDPDYVNILRSMKRKKMLDDTIIILFSDHGTRFGTILDTEEGRQESRLPLFQILFPARFRNQYKLAYKNFVTNSHRLTTPYDVHQTLLDLINPSELNDRKIKERSMLISGNEKALSLFLPIPTSRSCKSVNVPQHWCTCLGGEIVTIGDRGRAFTVKFLVRHINHILSEYPQCRKLSVENILEVTAVNKNTLSQRTYRVLMVTQPGGGVFEGTLVQERKRWMVSGSVSRLNSYKNQSYCVKDPFIKLYCFCAKK